MRTNPHHTKSVIENTINILLDVQIKSEELSPSIDFQICKAIYNLLELVPSMHPISREHKEQMEYAINVIREVL